MQITIEKSGPAQLGPYRDSVSTYRIVLSEPIGYYSPEQLRHYVAGLAAAACGRLGTVALSSKEGNWMDPYVVEVKEVNSMQWQVRIVHPYLD